MLDLLGEVSRQRMLSEMMFKEVSRRDEMNLDVLVGRPRLCKKDQRGYLGVWQGKVFWTNTWQA